MKAIDIFCASQASTAICLTMDQPSSSSSNILLSRSPAIDRHNPIIRDSRRSILIPPSTHTSPKPIHNKNHHKKKQSNNKNKQKNGMIKKADEADDEIINVKISTSVRKNIWSCTNPAAAVDFISPPGSTRYLLSDIVKNVLFDNSSDSGPARKILPPDDPKPEPVKTDEPCDVSKPPASASPPDQVVVLRVSLHCRGCEKKMRKHISRMEGVTSFNIDFAAKKVTVKGNITPLEVLSSITKVKNAQLWPPTISSSPLSSPALNLTMSNNSEFMKSHDDQYKGAGA